MTKRKQQIALCEWADSVGYNTSFMDDDGCEQPGLLDTDDLNVLHEMEMALKDTHGGSSGALDHEPVRYVYELSKIVGVEMREEQVVSNIKNHDGTLLLLNTSVYASPFESIKLVLATAAQRREALLKTLGLWK